MGQYVSIFLFGAVVLGAMLAGLVAARIIGPHRPDPAKLMPYECGSPLYGQAWVQVNVRYYLYALLFVIFDVEVIFLYPWAVAAKQLGLPAFMEMLVFLAILLTGLAYAWKKDALKWA